MLIDSLRRRLASRAGGLAAAALLSGLSACIGWPTEPWDSGCPASGCESPPWVTPYSGNVLRGDTIRFIACNDYTKCWGASDTGHVLAKWSLGDTGVVAIVAANPKQVESATNVVVRAVARGTANLSVTFPGSASSYPQTQFIRVADSSDIKSIELPFWAFGDTLRVGVKYNVAVNLRDVGGRIYRGLPTTYGSTDATVLRVTKGVAGYNGEFLLDVVGLKPGKAAVTATFLALTATREFTVIP